MSRKQLPLFFFGLTTKPTRGIWEFENEDSMSETLEGMDKKSENYT